MQPFRLVSLHTNNDEKGERKMTTAKSKKSNVSQEKAK